MLFSIEKMSRFYIEIDSFVDYQNGRLKSSFFFFSRLDESYKTIKFRQENAIL